ncbi:AAA family ATPase [Streptomyces sp. SID11233]|nr:AAA family ATPase [Streptomyces sp. SID11233]
MVFLHRADERAVVDKAVRGCADNASGLVLVEGSVGCGKTLLLEYAAAAAHDQGLTVVRATAGPASRRRDHALLRRLVDELAPHDPRPGTRPNTRPDPAAFAPLLRSACARGPVVLCVDDVHHADRESLTELVHLIQGFRDAPLLTLLGQTSHRRVDHPGLQAELLRHPGYTRIHLDRLDARETAELSRLWGAPHSSSSAESPYRLSGGNPLLLRALLVEADGLGCLEPVPGGPYAETFTACLDRCGPDAQRLAVALAVLGPDAGTDASRAILLAGLSPEAAAVAGSVLDAAGLAVGARLPHPTVAAAVLGTLGRSRLRALHREAAHVLHRTRGEPTSVARQLLAAEVAGHDWEVAALREAARHDTSPARSGAFLRLARSACPDGPTRLRATLQLAEHAWQQDSGEAHRLLDEPLAVQRAGLLPHAEEGWLVRLLATQGRIEEADEVLGHRADPGDRPASDDPLRELLAQLPNGVAHADGPPARAAALWLHPGAQHAVPAAEQLLKQTPLEPATFECISHALRTLVHHRPHTAVDWCRRLSAQAAHRPAPGWLAVFDTAHAEALLRLGDLTGAQRAATTALGHLAGRGGPYLLAPLATLVQALTGQGDFTAAARHLRPTLPGEPYTTVHALSFLRARGHYHLATGRPEAALAAFLDVGVIAVRWGLDQASVLPWRSDAAAALTVLGRPSRAQALLEQQRDLPDGGDSRVRGVSLRLHALAAEPRRRVELLTEAADLLRECGDRFELARTLSDLGSALQMNSEGTRAGAILRRARRLALDCGASPLDEHLEPATGEDLLGWRADDTGFGEAGLSDAEERVAAFASQGYTNKEIAAKLFVSVSTVEHHLTRAYRKLGISRRRDLPADLRTRGAEPALS